MCVCVCVCVCVLGSISLLIYISLSNRDILCLHIFVYILSNCHIEFIIFTNPSAWAGYDTSSVFKRSLTGLNSEFSFSETSCLTKAEEPSLSNYLPIAGGRIIGFIPFPRVLVLCEMQSVLARIWTHVAMSIFYNDNHYTTGTYIVTSSLWYPWELVNETSIINWFPSTFCPILGHLQGSTHTHTHIYIYIHIHVLYIHNTTTYIHIQIYVETINRQWMTSITNEYTSL